MASLSEMSYQASKDSAESTPTYTPKPSSTSWIDPSLTRTDSTIISDTQLGLTNEEIALLRQHQQDHDDGPYFIKPSGFRPNSLFVGRQDELREMHSILFDQKRRSNGTSAIALQCLPGGGKSHLARQYVYDHADDYPGGIFWVRAKSKEELSMGYWDIFRKVTYKDGAFHDGLPRAESYEETVRKWLNRRSDWLLVLDGCKFDAELLRPFLPDAVNTSLIFTSTEKPSGDYHFMNPQVIKLPMLSAREAQRLLLLELDKKEPFSASDLRSSMELVQAMEFLPVVIHSIAQRLKATDEPLSKFARNYENNPSLRGLGTYINIVDQLKSSNSIEALNLMRVLSFFSQHIPVEMLSLGRLLAVSPKISSAIN